MEEDRLLLSISCELLFLDKSERSRNLILHVQKRDRRYTPVIELIGSNEENWHTFSSSCLTNSEAMKPEAPVTTAVYAPDDILSEQTEDWRD